jgi:hypothetical protein
MKSDARSKPKKKLGPGKRKRDSEHEYGSSESDINKYRKVIPHEPRKPIPSEPSAEKVEESPKIA